MRIERESSPIVSVVIPTRNRGRLLREVIESLWQQTMSPANYEIIVVDNCSEDGTAEMIAELQTNSPCDLIYHRMAMNQGPVHSRNVGVAMARAEIIAFTDSDCAAASDWLALGVDMLQSTPDVAFVTGPVLDKPGQPVRIFTSRNGAPPGENPTYPSCNAFYRKKVFMEMGGFDESVWIRDLGGSPIECADTDLAWKIKKKGYPNLFLENLIIYHEVATLAPRNWLLAHVRLIVVPELVRRHPELRDKLLQWKFFFLADNPLFYLAVIGLALAAVSSVWFSVFALPYVYRAYRVPGRKFSLADVPRGICRTAVVSIRQTVVCASLVYGSIRSRTLVL